MKVNSTDTNQNTEDNNEITKSLIHLPVVKSIICSSRYTIYKTTCQRTQENLAMKVFKYQNGSIDPKFIYEARCLTFNHPNIIKIKEIVAKMASVRQNTNFFVSYILMELGICDFLSFAQLFQQKCDDKLARTLFQNLIDGVEYMHKNGFAHLDIKPENLILGKDFKLKLADFDLCYSRDDAQIRGTGTHNYRAPEMLMKTVEDPMKADMFSIGIMLFIFMLGTLPFLENQQLSGADLYSLALVDFEEYWETYKNFNRVDFELDPEFIKLFRGLINYNPKMRYDFEEIRRNEWFQGSIYSDEEMKNILSEDCE